MKDFSTRQDHGLRQQGRLRNTGLLALTALLLTGLLAGTAAAQNQGNAQFSFSDFFFIDGDPPELFVEPFASSTLLRSNRGVSVSIHAAGLTPGDVYTVWWIVFNNPNNCNGNPDFPQFNCVESNAFEKDVDDNSITGAAFCTAAGRVVDEFGFASFNAHLPMGDGQPNCLPMLPQTPLGQGPVTFVTGMTSRAAEIHVALRSHGPAETLTPEQLQEALTSLFGGCIQAGGPNTCVTTHFAVHER